MSSDSIPEAEVVCPYDSEHRVSSRLIHLHMAKCRQVFVQRHPDYQLQHCRYTPSHIIPDIEVDFHHEHCSCKPKKAEEPPQSAEHPTDFKPKTVDDLLDLL